MTHHITARQHQILNLLLKQRSGLSIDEIASTLTISRNAIQQHFVSLETDAYIAAGEPRKTAGRPVQTYVLTNKGINHFPKQYAWFSEMILSDLKETLGSDGFSKYMRKLGLTLAQSLLPQFEGKTTTERTEMLIDIMQELGFQANLPTHKQGYIHAHNCIYHDLAQKHEEICELDKILISTLMNKNVELVECMAKKDNICCFKVQKASPLSKKQAQISNLT